MPYTAYNFIEVSGSYTVKTTDNYVIINVDVASDYNVTLPDATACRDQVIYTVCTHPGGSGPGGAFGCNVIIKPKAGQQVLNAPDPSGGIGTGDSGPIIFISDGTAWWILGID